MLYHLTTGMIVRPALLQFFFVTAFPAADLRDLLLGFRPQFCQLLLRIFSGFEATEEPRLRNRAACLCAYLLLSHPYFIDCLPGLFTVSHPQFEPAFAFQFQLFQEPRVGGNDIH